MFLYATQCTDTFQPPPHMPSMKIFLDCLKIKLHFCEIYDYQKGKAAQLFSPSSLVVVGPGIQYGKNQDPGSGINIPDPQHWFQFSSGNTLHGWVADPFHDDPDMDSGNSIKNRLISCMKT